MLVRRRSGYSGKEHEMEVDVTDSQIQAWREGELIQRAMPNLTDDEREFIMNGITPGEWNEMMGPET